MASNWFLTIAVVGLGFYLRTYIKAKAQHLAEKEDVKEITNTIESVKNKFNSDIELLKTRLDFSKSLNLSSIEEEKRALLEFYQHYYEWFQLVSNPYSFAKACTVEECNILMRTEEALSLKLQLSEGKLNFFIEDIELKQSYRNLLQSSDEIKIIVFIEFGLYVKGIIIQAGGEVSQKIGSDPILDRLQGIKEELMKAFNKHYLLDAKFTDFCREYLKGKEMIDEA